MKIKNKFWFDITNVPHVNFLLPIIRHLDPDKPIFSIRDFAETKSLFEKRIGEEYLLIGSHKGQNKLMKIWGSFVRIFDLQKQIPRFDVKISVGGDASCIVAKLRRKISITFDDNEKAPNWRYSRFSDLAFWPDAIDDDVLYRQGFKKKSLFKYQGFKEDLYLADYVPDETFLKELPFAQYVVLRPENIQANYADGSAKSIVPQLLDKFRELGLNVLFLPRYEHDRILSNDFENVYAPETAVNGLDACYFSDAVFTGAGTMAREAACLGIPAFSFYTGKELLTVDQKMIDLGWLYFSRDPEQLIRKFSNLKKRKPDLKRSKMVKQQILSKLDEFLSIHSETANLK
jgi:predicted glycosyltransferase